MRYNTEFGSRPLLEGLLAMEVRKLAERTGFEPAVACATTVFKTVTFNHSVTSPLGNLFYNLLEYLKEV